MYSSFKDNISGVDLADMQSLSKYNRGIKYLLCAIDLFSKYVWIVPIRDKKGTSIVNTFKKIISERRTPNKIWVDQGSEFYNQSFKDFLKINNIEMYSTFNEGKSHVAERLIRTLKNRIFKHMTTISKNVYIEVLNDIVNKYNNTVHRTIKMLRVVLVWNKDQCRCECKELVDKGVCDKGFIFNPSNCKCECDKSCNTRQYLDYSDCKCKKKIIDLIVENVLSMMIKQN